MQMRELHKIDNAIFVALLDKHICIYYCIRFRLFEFLFKEMEFILII